MDSREISEWQAYFMIINEKTKEENKDPALLGEQIKAGFTMLRK